MNFQSSISSLNGFLPPGGDPEEDPFPGGVSPVQAALLHVGILVEGRYLLQAQPLGVAAELKARGHRVTVVVPESHAYGTGDKGRFQGMDLVISRGRSPGLLCLLHLAEAQGIATTNRRSAVGSVHNKAEIAITLSAAGIPTPPAYVGPIRELARSIPAEEYPVVLKAVSGDYRIPSHIIRSVLELARISWPEPAALAQRFQPGSGYDLKLYVIGRDVWALRKRSCLEVPPAPEGESTSPGDEALPVSPASAAETVALKCGGLFGLDYYSVDCIETPEGPVVIDVKEFPDYAGVDGAEERLADHALRLASRRKR
jgi:ribosomal protein S6--L-glutamate ligase